MEENNQLPDDAEPIAVPPAAKPVEPTRAEIVSAIARMDSLCVHVNKSGVKIAPHGLREFLSFRAYSLKDSEAAFAAFAESGFWQSPCGGYCFGTKETTL